VLAGECEGNRAEKLIGQTDRFPLIRMKRRVKIVRRARLLKSAKMGLLPNGTETARARVEVICNANILEFPGLVDRGCNRSRISLDRLPNRSLSKIAFN